MKQPKKKCVIKSEPIKKKKKKNGKQPLKKDIGFFEYNKISLSRDKSDDDVSNMSSNLEILFEDMFLKKLKVKYTKQFHTPIGRYYDFYLSEFKILIEVDGDYWHCNPRKYDKPINAIQIKNKRIDEIKNKWALLNEYRLIRYWEYDIKNHPKKIMIHLKNIIKSLQNEK